MPAEFPHSHPPAVPRSPPFHLGSCAWTHDDWRGSFYPGDLPPSRWLAWYARIFNAVEIDSTFYASPPAHAVARWLAAAPPHFRFACKLPKAITHQNRLRGCEKILADFLEAMRPLHAHLGPILIQLPPSFAPARDDTALREFILGLPRGWKFAIEFRHADWHLPRFVKLLGDHGIGWVWSDTTSVENQDQGPFGFLPETADFLYLRLMGDQRTKYGPGGKHVFQYRELLWSRAVAVESWAVRLHKQAERVKAIYILCNNHFEGFAPATCRQLAARLGIEIIPPPNASPEPAPEGGPRQMKLL